MSKILVVDDLPYNIEFLEEALTKLRFEVINASNGEEGLRQVADIDPDLVLLRPLQACDGRVGGAQISEGLPRPWHTPGHLTYRKD